MKEAWLKIEKALFENEYKSWQVFFIYLLMAFFVFSPTFSNLNFFWDDEKFIFLNPEVLNSKKYFDFWNPNSSSFKSWPLGYALFSFLMKYSYFQGIIFYKALNILLHTLNGFLIYKILKKFHLKYSFVLPMFFLIHPLHVETVSWIFQLLTILAGSFILISFIFFCDFLFFNSKKKYSFSLLMFLFSLWSKSIAILFPFFYLVIFMFNKRNFVRYFYILPFFFLSLTVGIINIQGANYHVIAKGYSMQSDEMHLGLQFFNKYRSLFGVNIDNHVSKSKKYLDDKQYYESIFGKDFETNKIKKLNFERSKVLFYSIVHYPLKLFFPIDLQFIYPKKMDMLYTVFVLISVCIGFYFLFFKIGIIETIYSLTYLFVSLAPFMGLTFITFFYWSYVSDRYSYLFVLLILWPIYLLIIKTKPRFAISYLAFFIIMNIHHGLVFNNPITLYSRALKHSKHPAIYSALFEEQILKQDFSNAAKTIEEGLQHFPEDKLLLDRQFRIKIYELNFKK